MFPHEGLYNLYIFLSKVDFPEPLGPIIPTNDPFFISKDISFKISVLSILNFKLLTCNLKITHSLQMNNFY